MDTRIFEAVRKELKTQGFEVMLHKFATPEDSTHLLFQEKDGRQIGQPMTAVELQDFLVKYEQTSGPKALFRFYFLDGTVRQAVHKVGEVGEAFSKLGYGGGAVRALDYYDEIPL